MSISAMKQALQALEFFCEYGAIDRPFERIAELKQAIAEAEKQEPAFYVIPATDRFGEGYEQTYWEDPAGFPVYTRPVCASDINQEPVDETAKDRHEFAEMVKKGTKAWDGVPDDWVDDLRGGADKQDPDDDIYDVWVEQGTSQENRQVAMRPATRDEKIVNPGVYEVPLFDCPRCGHCCREWVGLTKDEVDSWELPVVPTVFQFAQFVEAKLKEKNVPQP